MLRFFVKIFLCVICIWFVLIALEYAYRYFKVEPQLPQLIGSVFDLEESFAKLSQKQTFDYYDVGAAVRENCETLAFGCFDWTDFTNVGILMARMPNGATSAHENGLITRQCGEETRNCVELPKFSASITGIHYSMAERYGADIAVDRYGTSIETQDCRMRVIESYDVEVCKQDILFDGKITDHIYTARLAPLHFERFFL